MKYFGHENLIGLIRAYQPRVSLFLGPLSCGKWTLAEYFLREEWGVLPVDVLRVNRLTADNSRMIEEFALSAPVGDVRVVICRLRKASVVSQNILLKTLEDAPKTTIFFLIAEELPLPTVTSRCSVFRFGPLRDEDVEKILVEVKRFRPEVAADRARLARGSVQTALEYSDTKERKLMVLRVLEAFLTKDPQILEGLASRWTEEHTDLLVTCCQEIITKRWRIFSEEETGCPTNRIPLKILMALRAEVRPRLAIRSSLLSALQGER